MSSRALLPNFGVNNMGESDLIEKANDSSDCPEQHGMESSLVGCPPEGWFSGHFLSVTEDEEPGSRANDPRDAITPMSTC